MVEREKIRPASPLNLSSPPATDTTPCTITIPGVIVYEGPGSWKKEAYWDEYLITITNQGSSPLTVTSAVVVDFQNRRVTAGDNPWDLEEESRTLPERLASTGGTTLKMGAGLVTTSVGGMVAGAMLSTASGLGGGLAVVGAGAMGMVVAAPVFVGATVYRNVSNRHRVEAEFQRRRLVLPTTLAPGQMVTGSLFFSISPGPRRMELDLHTPAETRKASIDLAPLRDLHLDPSSASHVAGGH